MIPLFGQEGGRYELKTASGTHYLIDLDSMTLMRFPMILDAEPEIALWLRSDHTPIRLLRVFECTVGLPAIFAIDLGIDGVPFTLRTTATVCSIKRDGETN